MKHKPKHTGPDEVVCSECGEACSFVPDQAECKGKIINIDMASEKDKTGYRYTVDDRFIFFTNEPLSDEELEAIKADPEYTISVLKEMGFISVQL